MVQASRIGCMQLGQSKIFGLDCGVSMRTVLPTIQQRVI